MVKNLLIPSRKLSVVDQQNKIFNGQICLFTATGTKNRDLKILDIYNNKILSIITDADKFKKLLDSYKYFQPHFKISKIFSYDSSKNTIIEELIVSKPRTNWLEREYQKVMDTIFISYIHNYPFYVKKYNYKSENMLEKVYNLKNDNILNGITNNILDRLPKEFLYLEVPIIYQHGDINLHNIMLGKDNEIYFIDWNKAGYYSILYDLFNWIRSEGNSNLYEFKRYMLGGYDEKFEEVFSIFEMKFEKQSRLEYFYLFLLESLYRRVINRDKKTKKLRLNEYQRLLANIGKELEHIEKD